MTNRITCQRPVQLHYLFGTISYENKATLPNRHIKKELQKPNLSSQSLNLDSRRGTTDDVAKLPFHISLSSAALRESPNSIPVHSLMLSSHLFVCLSLLLRLQNCLRHARGS